MSIGCACLLLLLGLSVAPATAHAPDLVRPETLWTSWNVDPWVLIPLMLTSWLYGHGVRRLWARAGWGRGVSGGNILACAAGQIVLIAALVSPLDGLSGTLLTAHMAQHGLLVGLAPPLLLLGKPSVALVWALSESWLKCQLVGIVWRALSGLGNVLCRPLRAAALHGVMLWLWHVPALFGMAVEHRGLHALEHVCFFGTALLFWRAVCDARSSRRAGPALAAAFITFMHSGLLGGLITMAPEPLYAVYIDRSPMWGLTALDDQQLAGLFMWVPLGLPYLAVGLWLTSRLISGPFDEASTIGAGGPHFPTPRRAGDIFMIWVSLCCLVLFMFAPGLARAQDSTAAATGTESREEAGVIQVGAGTKGDATTGSSGRKGAANPVLAPEAPGFALTPPTHDFQGPGMLEVQAPQRLRCELIGHDNARRRCETKTARPY